MALYLLCLCRFPQDKYFRLENVNTPKILVKSILDYDVVQKISLVLHVQVSNDLWKHPARFCFFCKKQSEVCFLQDTFNGSASNKPFFTSVATITVRVKDVDNRPPWFQPCTRTNLGAAKLCVSSGYRGKVNLTEKQVGSDSDVYISKKRNVLHMSRKSLTWLTSLGLILIVHEPSCYSSSHRKKLKTLLYRGSWYLIWCH